MTAEVPSVYNSITKDSIVVYVLATPAACACVCVCVCLQNKTPKLQTNKSAKRKSNIFFQVTPIR